MCMMKHHVGKIKYLSPKHLSKSSNHKIKPTTKK